ncbi:MAG: nucleotide sugar dehydrogenase [Rhodospirillales bacterium]
MPKPALPENPSAAVIGLGYVGLPLAAALARRLPVIGFDSDTARVAELKSGHDRTGEIESSVLQASSMQFTDDVNALRGADVFIITVPTPVDAADAPDLSALKSASRSVGGVIAPGAVVVFESTVYPGVTEDICGPILAEASGLECGVDFFLGYSPERINPGDKTHTVDKITKVVAGQTPEAAAALAKLYGGVTSGGVHIAPDIRTAEASKVIENAQRDINIAFINEVALIFERMGIDTHAVLEASRTKWNFLDFRPGLVGGHCIGVDPFYLAHAAQAAGHNPEVILAGRRINDAMAAETARRIAAHLHPASGARILALGLTFKENVPDLRNSKAADVVRALRESGHTVDVHDPMADKAGAKALHGVDLLPGLAGAKNYDAVICLVAHAPYAALTADELTAMVKPDGLIADVKGVWRGLSWGPAPRRWSL